MKILKTFLENNPFFHGMLGSEIDKLLKHADHVRFLPDEQIFREGEDATRLFLIAQGKAAIQMYEPGNGAITLETLGENDILGWSWLFPPHQWHFDAKAVELLRAYTFDAKGLLQEFEQDPHFGMEIHRRFSGLLMQRLKTTRLRYLQLYSR